MFGLNQSLRYKFLPYTQDQENAFVEFQNKICDGILLTEEENRMYFYLKPLLALGGNKGTTCIALNSSGISSIRGTNPSPYHTIYFTEEVNPSIGNGFAVKTNKIKDAK